MNAIFVQGLSSAFSMCSAHREFNRPNGIDIALVNGDGVVVAIETKGMVSNSHRGDRNRISIDVHGVRTKLYRDKRDNNSIESDIADSAGKIPIEMVCPRFELFVPVVYELYRQGGTESDWFAERKPWVTLPGFEQLRENMKDDLTEWFAREDPSFRLIHAAESVELRGANELWKRQSQRKYREYKSLEAYVSFYAFARFVE